MICFITDGGPQIGMGHIQQSTSLAKRFCDDCDVKFITKSDETAAEFIRQRGFDVVRLSGDPEILDWLRKHTPDVVIFDKIDVEERLAKAIKQNLTVSLVIFTNLTAANRYADIAVTADIGSKFENISYTDHETGTSYYFGPKYWVLRPEFHDYKIKDRSFPRRPNRVLLIFGGSDPSNLTSAVLDQLLRLEGVLVADVIIGAHFSHNSCLNTILARGMPNGKSVTIHRNTSRVAELMHAADLTIASPGLSTFESLCLGTPVLVVPHDELQRDTYRGFFRILEKDKLGELGEVLERADFTYAQDERIAAMHIGQGEGELVSLILNSIKRR